MSPRRCSRRASSTRNHTAALRKPCGHQRAVGLRPSNEPACGQVQRVEVEHAVITRDARLAVVIAAAAMATCKGPQGDLASVAAVGDSITARYRLSYSYPDLLGRWRGIPVRNFGVSGDTTAPMLPPPPDAPPPGPL